MVACRVLLPCFQVVIGSNSNQVFMVMEYVDHDLRKVLEGELKQRPGQLPFSTAQVMRSGRVGLGLGVRGEGLRRGGGAALLQHGAALRGAGRDNARDRTSLLR
jgi:hypothetical protein